MNHYWRPASDSPFPQMRRSVRVRQLIDSIISALRVIVVKSIQAEASNMLPSFPFITPKNNYNMPLPSHHRAPNRIRRLVHPSNFSQMMAMQLREQSMALLEPAHSLHHFTIFNDQKAEVIIPSTPNNTPSPPTKPNQNHQRWLVQTPSLLLPYLITPRGRQGRM